MKDAASPVVVFFRQRSTWQVFPSSSWLPSSKRQRQRAVACKNKDSLNHASKTKTNQQQREQNRACHDSLPQNDKSRPATYNCIGGLFWIADLVVGVKTVKTCATVLGFCCSSRLISRHPHPRMADSCRKTCISLKYWTDAIPTERRNILRLRRMLYLQY